MVKTGIKIFARIRPIKKSSGQYEIQEKEDGLFGLTFTVPRSEAGGAVNNKRETYKFRFTNVFDQQSSQEEVFNEVARGVIDNCLEGYNGTIFAYGQTGSGKTFTITGGVERYSDRGLIPRALSYLFKQYDKSPGTIFTTHISYLEIYNEYGYDLLDPRHEAARLEDLPKVTLLEDSESMIHLRNLSLHQASNEEEALNWLFLGDTNRMMAETPMNMASTRSHCIFTVHIFSRQPGSDTVRKAKLHLVDLAGSERVGKTGVEGTLLTEAKYINLSLHFLEQVIVALSEKSRSHIPYRNSMMTSVLRDSLGGNCMTSMIATCSVEKRNIDETISTCRFSQRVALVKNEAVLNEELDPKLMVLHLKQKVAELKDELTLATGEEREGDLSEAEAEKCRELVQAYLEDESAESRLLVGGDMRKIQLCFAIMKAEVKKRHTPPAPPPPTAPAAPSTPAAPAGPPASSTPTEGPNSPPGPSPSEPIPPSVSQQGRNEVTSDPKLHRLKEILQQRDDEINVLLKMLKQERRRAAEAEAALKRAGLPVPIGHTPILGRTSPVMTSIGEVGRRVEGEGEEGEGEGEGEGGGRRGEGEGREEEGDGRRPKERDDSEWSRTARKAELSRVRQEAFDSFRQDCADMAVVTQHKTVLKSRYSEAKTLGERVNTSRATINKLKSQLERHRISRGLAGIAGGGGGDGPDEQEQEMKRDIEAEKKNFKVLYQQLRGLKTEIEHTQHLLERAKVEVQRQFEEWWEGQLAQGKVHYPPPSQAAWRTPPTSSSPAPPSHPSPHHPSQDPHPSHTVRPSSTRRARSRQGRRVAAQFSASEHSKGSSAESSGHVRANPDISGHVRASPDTSGHVRTSSASLGQSQPKLPQVGRASSIPQPLFPPHTLTSSTHKRPSPPAGSLRSSLPLTGDSKADADIIAFYKARQKLIERGQPVAK